MKITTWERIALEYLYKAWNDYSEPLRSVHTPYGLMRYFYGTRYNRSVTFWQKVLKNLKKKGLVSEEIIGFDSYWRLTQKGEEVLKELGIDVMMRKIWGEKWRYA